MSTDYVLFIHGVNTRQPTYADNLINLINHITPIQPLVVFWGKHLGYGISSGLETSVNSHCSDPLEI
jgi:hypothetical protein